CWKLMCPGFISIAGVSWIVFIASHFASVRNLFNKINSKGARGFGDGLELPRREPARPSLLNNFSFSGWVKKKPEVGT
ncbi:hypothetical protein A2U01_0033347, partial [Trifolium medium]|nr:hypothetical protein [Trifolium medium]